MVLYFSMMYRCLAACSFVGARPMYLQVWSFFRMVIANRFQLATVEAFTRSASAWSGNFLILTLRNVLLPCAVVPLVLNSNPFFSMSAITSSDNPRPTRPQYRNDWMKRILKFSATSFGSVSRRNFTNDFHVCPSGSLKLL